jgi:Tol biopolymer transport system component
MKIYPIIMPDGRILFSEMSVAMNAWSVAARTDEAAVLAKPQKLTQDVMQNFTPTISRDGTKAAFNAFGGAQASKIEIRVKDLRTGEETKVPVQGMSVNQFPRLSPDGSLLAYRDIVEGRVVTFLVAPGISAPRALCESCTVFGFFPGNDSALVQFRPDELETMDLRTGERKVLLPAAREVIEDAGVSPDGQWIAWLAGEPDGRVAIRIAPAAALRAGTRSPITVAESDDYLGQPAWSPNGRWLYYLSEKSGRCALFVREVDPRTQAPIGAERLVLETAESRLFMNFPKGNGQIGVAADKIIFEGTVMAGNVYLAKPKKR